MHHVRRSILALFISAGLLCSHAFAQEEIQALLDRLLARPTITAESGFSATLLVPPGQLYDPLWMLPQDGAVWLNDDGGEEGEKGSRILSVTKDGTVSVLVGLGRLLPTTGFDVAPEGFGAFAGQIFALAQARVALEGATANHVIQRVDPRTQEEASVVCTLPKAGNVNQGISGFGVDARFGPPGSPFANKFFAITAYNSTIYQMTADGVCSPFITFDGEPWGSPTGLEFSADGQAMLVAVTQGSLLAPPAAGAGAVVRVSPEGRVEEKPVVQGLTRPMGIARAPATFGPYAGQLFVTDVGDIQAPVPMTQALKADGKLYRATPEGELHLVASGFVNPAGVRFLDDALWVTDIGGDFIAGKRELPDGFIVKIQSQ
jgi:hypothetical protein